MQVIKRNGKVVPFDKTKIHQAILKTFTAIEGEHAGESDRVNKICLDLSDKVASKLTPEDPISIDHIQNEVEKTLMNSGYYNIAKSYINYRKERDDARKETVNVSDEIDQINKMAIGLASIGVDIYSIIKTTANSIYEGIKPLDYHHALIMVSRSMIERDPIYSHFTADLLLEYLKKQASDFLNFSANDGYEKYFPSYIAKAINLGLLSPKLMELFDIVKLGKSIQHQRDGLFTYLGLQTLYDRYFIRYNKENKSIPFELPQAFFMRVAMGLASREEGDPNEKAISFYNLISSFDFMCSTPTLFNSGTNCPQLSSCYLTTIHDSIDGIFEGIKENAKLSKYAGGLGNDWTPVRGRGAYIKDTNGHSKGVVPFMKVANDTAVAVNQGGKRKGAVCSYLETWHIDIESYIQMRKNTGDDRLRTHDMNTANWIPDLFMKRVTTNGDWTLFSPDEVPELHDLYGQAFTEKYEYYEKHAHTMNSKKVKAVDLWRKMLGMVFETGHPWMCFKDPCNIRSPQQHCGVVHSSNLCTEITLNTADDEIAVCNLGSINLIQHIGAGGIIHSKLKNTIRTAIRMLDNVIDYNYYPVIKAENSNKKHRPIGLGVMGFQDALYKLRIPYESDKAVEFADQTMEAISYYAIQASSELAKERGVYSSYFGSLWNKGYLPVDTLNKLKDERGEEFCNFNTDTTMDWSKVRAHIKDYGMRNSNVLAIAPTATIANICGVTQSIEPTYSNLFVKSNLSGEFTVINPYLIEDLKKAGLWDDTMINDLKYHDGNLKDIDRIDFNLKQLYATAFEIDPASLINAAVRRQKWIDQAQSLNLYLGVPSGKKLDEMYRMAWKFGLKTTYYLRSLGATHVEKASVDKTNLNAVSACPTDTECEACT